MSTLRHLHDNFALKVLVLACLLLIPIAGRSQAPMCSMVFHGEAQNIESGYIYLGEGIRPHLFSILERAQSSIDIEMSLAPNKELFELLRRKRQQGVQIRAILDNRSANKSPKHRQVWDQVIADLQSIGVDYAVSDKEALIQARGYPGSVLHRKLILVDEKYFYLGSSNFTVHDMNLEMGYFGPTNGSSSFKEVFNSDYKAAQQSWKTRVEKAKGPSELDFKDESLQLVGPGTQHPDFRGVILQQISSAKKQILISAYEATDSAILHALVEKKKSAPEMDIRVVLCTGKLPVRILGKNIEIPKNAGFMSELLKAGIDVRAYGNESQYNHSRFGLFDGVIYGGSADFVQRSFQGSVDLAFISNDGRLANLSKSSFESLWTSSRDVQNVTVKDRLIESFFIMVERINYFFLQMKLLAKEN